MLFGREGVPCCSRDALAAGGGVAKREKGVLRRDKGTLESDYHLSIAKCSAQLQAMD